MGDNISTGVIFGTFSENYSHIIFDTLKAFLIVDMMHRTLASPSRLAHSIIRNAIVAPARPYPLHASQLGRAISNGYGQFYLFRYFRD